MGKLWEWVGLISDTVQLVDDKVPMLGDIPMLGRLVSK